MFGREELCLKGTYSCVDHKDACVWAFADNCQIPVGDLLTTRKSCTMTSPLPCSSCSIQYEFVGTRPTLSFRDSVAMIL